MKLNKLLTSGLILAFVLSTAWIPVAAAPLAGGGTTRQIPSGGTTSPQTGGFTPSGSGDATQVEFAGETDSGAGADASRKELRESCAKNDYAKHKQPDCDGP